ncbi:hypothetical protein [Leuconostoc lactis]
MISFGVLILSLITLIVVLT